MVLTCLEMKIKLASKRSFCPLIDNDFILLRTESSSECLLQLFIHTFVFLGILDKITTESKQFNGLLKKGDTAVENFV